MTFLAFFDESETPDPAIYGMAGYVFEAEAAKKLEVEWRSILDEYGLPYFHMIECAHGIGIFESFDKPTRIKIQTRLFEVLKRHALLAVIVLFEMKLKEYLTTNPIIGMRFLEGGETHSPHSLCCYWCIRLVGQWAEKNNLPPQNILYFFEAGAADQGMTSRLLDIIGQLDSVTLKLSYAGHAFLKKRSSAGIQCADILAWQSTKSVKNRLSGRPERADFKSLKSVPALHFSINARNYKSLARRYLHRRNFLRRRETALVWWWAELQKDGWWLVLPGEGPRLDASIDLSFSWRNNGANGLLK